MKIRHKELGVELEVDGRQPFPAFYVTSGGSLINRQDNDWVLVKEEAWEDITGECEWTEIAYSEFYMKAPNGERIEHISFRDKYRLRKIDGLHNGPAFIVERKKP